MENMSNGVVNAEKCPFADLRAWAALRAEWEKTAQKVDTIHATVHDVSKDTKNLDVLPIIAHHLETMSTALVGPATSKKQIPEKIFFLSHAFTLAIIVILATLLILERINLNKADLLINSSGVSVTH